MEMGYGQIEQLMLEVLVHTGQKPYGLGALMGDMSNDPVVGRFMKGVHAKNPPKPLAL